MDITRARRFAVLMGGLMVLSAIPLVGSSHGIDVDNLVVMDGRENPARVTSQIMNGTTAHVKVQVESAGTYILKDPAGNALGQADAVAGYATFVGMHLTDNGWYRIFTVGEVTRFNVSAYVDGDDLQSLRSSDLKKMTAEQFDAFLPGGYTLQGLHMEDSSQPGVPASCTKIPYSEVPFDINPAAVDIDANELTRFQFKLPFKVSGPVPLPIAGAHIRLTGNQLIPQATWQFDLNPAPNPAATGVYNLYANAFVFLGGEGSQSVVLRAEGCEEVIDILNPDGPVECKEWTFLNVTVLKS